MTVTGLSAFGHLGSFTVAMINEHHGCIILCAENRSNILFIQEILNMFPSIINVALCHLSYSKIDIPNPHVALQLPVLLRTYTCYSLRDFCQVQLTTPRFHGQIEIWET